MAAIPREKIIARRERLANKQAKFKAMQERLKKEERRLAALDRKREETRLKIIGRIFEYRMRQEPELKEWFDGMLAETLTLKSEREVFGLENRNF